MSRIGLLAASITGLSLHAAQAWEVPVCGRPAVIERVETLLGQSGRLIRLNPAVGERSVGTDRLVHCAMQGHIQGYDTDQTGMQPINATFVVRYTLELRQNGIFLQID